MKDRRGHYIATEDAATLGFLRSLTPPIHNFPPWKEIPDSLLRMFTTGRIVIALDANMMVVQTNQKLF
jgi:hypothetical protein